MVPESDFELHEAALDEDGDRPVRAISWRIITLGALACALVIAGVAHITQPANNSAGATVHPSPTNSGSGEPGQAGGSTTVGGLPPGWQYAAPGDVATNVQAIARSTDAMVQYACGSNDNQHSYFSISHNGGRTWSGEHVIGAGSRCLIAINPDQPNLVAMTIYSVGFEAFPAQCWSSVDGGSTFAAIVLPDHGNCDSTLQWVGNRLFVAMYQGPAITRSAKVHLLAQSDGTAPFTWVTGIDGFGAADVAFIGTIAGALYLRLDTQSTTLVVRSTDGGTTWQPATFTIGKQPLMLMGIMPGTALCIAEANNRLYVSSDGGTQWRGGPPLPIGVSLPAYGGYVTPNGTLVTQFAANAQSDPGMRIYTAQLGETNWHPIAPQTQDFSVTAIAWDAQGRLSTLYGSDIDGHLATYAVAPTP